MKSFKVYLSHPVFWLALVFKLVCGSLFASHYLRDLFIPFTQYFVASHFSNPWEEFLRRGVLDAFPYSSVILLVLAIPQTLGALLWGGVAHIPWHAELFLMRLPLLAADVAIYLILCSWLQTQWRSVLLLYWLSPVLFFINYIHGQIDVVPTAFLLMSLWLATSGRPRAAGFLLATGIGAKFHLIAAVPLIGFSLYRLAQPWNRVRDVLGFTAFFAAGLALWIGPLLPSEAYRTMVLGAKEAQWVYEFGWTMSQGTKILFCPLAIMGLILHFFSYRRVTRDILVLYTGLLYTLLISLVQPMPGWAYWSVPFLVYFLVRHSFRDYIPFWIYSLSYCVYYLWFAPGIGSLPIDPANQHWVHLRDLVFTGMQASLVLTAFWMYRVGVKSYVDYRHLRAITTIGIGGDSASGKHTLANVLAKVTGGYSTIRLHGDDYHRWPRHHEAWKSQTHLDPRSNYFRQPLQHIRDLKSGITIHRATYDHAQGIFLPPEMIAPNRFIVFEGLHPFLYPAMREAFDIKIFLLTDEPLRRRWKLERDVAERQKPPEAVHEEILRREPDSNRYIHPQAAYADWLIEYALTDEAPADGPLAAGHFKVAHQISTALVEVEGLVEALAAYADKGLTVDWSVDMQLQRHFLKVKGVISADAVAAISHALYPHAHEDLAREPEWLADLDGVNQLILLAFVEKLRAA